MDKQTQGKLTQWRWIFKKGIPEDPGIISRSIQDIFKRVDELEGSTVSVTVSFYEIYNEKVNDLVDTKKTNLIITNSKSGVVIVDGTNKKCTNMEQVLEYYNNAKNNRKVEKTGKNDRSSRSHSVFIIRLNQYNEANAEHKSSTFIFVDLAGSEKLSKTHAEGSVLEEAKNINTSLTTLGRVIVSLSENDKFVPYRDSKLTRILADSIGGNSITQMIITCSLEEDDVKETVSSLRFGERAKNIKNKPKENKKETVASLMKKLRVLQARLAAYEKGEVPISESKEKSELEGEVAFKEEPKQDIQIESPNIFKEGKCSECFENEVIIGDLEERIQSLTSELKKQQGKDKMMQVFGNNNEAGLLDKITEVTEFIGEGMFSFFTTLGEYEELLRQLEGKVNSETFKQLNSFLSEFHNFFDITNKNIDSIKEVKIDQEEADKDDGFEDVEFGGGDMFEDDYSNKTPSINKFCCLHPSNKVSEVEIFGKEIAELKKMTLESLEITKQIKKELEIRSTSLEIEKEIRKEFEIWNNQLELLRERLPVEVENAELLEIKGVGYSFKGLDLSKQYSEAFMKKETILEARHFDLEIESECRAAYSEDKTQSFGVEGVGYSFKGLDLSKQYSEAFMKKETILEARHFDLEIKSEKTRSFTICPKTTEITIFNNIKKNKLVENNIISFDLLKSFKPLLEKENIESICIYKLERKLAEVSKCNQLEIISLPLASSSRTFKEINDVNKILTFTIDKQDPIPFELCQSTFLTFESISKTPNEPHKIQDLQILRISKPKQNFEIVNWNIDIVKEIKPNCLDSDAQTTYPLIEIDKLKNQIEIIQKVKFNDEFSKQTINIELLADFKCCSDKSNKKSIILNSVTEADTFSLNSEPKAISFNPGNIQLESSFGSPEKQHIKRVKANLKSAPNREINDIVLVKTSKVSNSANEKPFIENKSFSTNFKGNFYNSNLLKYKKENFCLSKRKNEITYFNVNIEAKDPSLIAKLTENLDQKDKQMKEILLKLAKIENKFDNKTQWITKKIRTESIFIGHPKILKQVRGPSMMVKRAVTSSEMILWRSIRAIRTINGSVLVAAVMLIFFYLLIR